MGGEGGGGGGGGLLAVICRMGHPLMGGEGLTCSHMQDGPPTHGRGGARSRFVHKTTHQRGSLSIVPHNQQNIFSYFCPVPRPSTPVASCLLYSMGSFELQCNSTDNFNGDTIAVYRWYLNGQLVEGVSDGTLNVSNVTNGDMYQCEVINIDGVGLNSSGITLGTDGEGGGRGSFPTKC